MPPRGTPDPGQRPLTLAALQDIQSVRRAAPVRIRSWVAHPDPVVPKALLRRHLRRRVWGPRWDQAYGFVLVGRAEIEARKEGVAWSRFLDDACRFAQAEGADKGAGDRLADRLAALPPAERRQEAVRLLRFRYPPVLLLAGQLISPARQGDAITLLHRPGLAPGLARNQALAPDAVDALGQWLMGILGQLEPGPPTPEQRPSWDDVEGWVEVALRLAHEGWAPPDGFPLGPSRPPRGSSLRARQRDAVRVLAAPVVSFALSGGTVPVRCALEGTLARCNRALPPQAVRGLAQRRWPDLEAWLRLLDEAPSPALLHGLAHGWPAEPPHELRRVLRAFFKDADSLSKAAYPHNLTPVLDAVAHRVELRAPLREVALELLLAGTACYIVWPVYLAALEAREHLLAVLPALLGRSDMIQEVITHPLGGAPVLCALLRLPGAGDDADAILRAMGALRRDPAVRAAVMTCDRPEAKLLLLKDRRYEEYPELLPFAAEHQPILAIEVLESATPRELARVSPEALAPLFDKGDQRLRERAMRCLGKVGRE